MEHFQEKCHAEWAEDLGKMQLDGLTASQIRPLVCFTNALCMLKRIVGWRRIPEEKWSVIMSRMKMRVNAALDQWPIKPWSFCNKASRWKHTRRVKMTEPIKWVSLACKWVPGYIFDLWYDCVPHRHVGGQFLKWDDSLAKFSQSILHCKWHDTACSGMILHDMRFYA